MQKQALQLLARGESKAGFTILSLTEFGPSSFKEIERILRTGEGADVRAFAKAHYVTQIGAQNAGRLAQFARSTDDYNALLEAAQRVKDAEDRAWDGFFAQVVPKTDHRVAKVLQAVASRNDATAAIVAEHMLGARGEGWKWQEKENERPKISPARTVMGSRPVTNALKEEPLLSKLYALSNDDRWEIAQLAVNLAGPYEEAPGTTSALIRALGGPHQKVRDSGPIFRDCRP